MLVCVAILESLGGRFLAPRVFSHELDELLWDLQGEPFDKPVVVLGDSVGRQISLELREHAGMDFAPLATSAAVEMAGNLFIFRRYLERNRPPERVVLFMRNPLDGDLKKVWTENYVQRGFTRWGEIGSLAWQTRNPAFGLRMLSYRLASAKYRLQLQRAVPGLNVKDSLAGMPREELIERKKELKKLTLRERLVDWILPRSTSTISEHYFLTLLEECGRRNIPVHFQPTPMRKSKIDTPEEVARRSALFARMRELAARHPLFTFTDEVAAYPDGCFVDGIHIQARDLPRISAAYAEVLGTGGAP